MSARAIALFAEDEALVLMMAGDMLANARVC